VLAARTPAVEPERRAATAIAPAELQALVGRWTRLLADCDAASLDDLDKESGSLRALFDGASAFDGFAQQVKAYDFDGALEGLRRAASDKGIQG
jgi:hypothetical protein